MSDVLPVKLVIASRESRLAMWQAEYIRDRLTALYPQMRVEILGMTTQGDRILDKPLAKIGGKGLFVKELETALESGDADIADIAFLETTGHRRELIGFALDHQIDRLLGPMSKGKLDLAAGRATQFLLGLR